MKKAKNIIAAAAALCITACILPSCFIRISDKAKEDIRKELEEGKINFENGYEAEEPEVPDSLDIELDALDNLIENKL